MNETLFRMHLEEPAAPGFCSLSKSYFGTLDDFSAVISNMAQMGCNQDTVQAFRAYQEGNIEAEHTVCYNKDRLLKPVGVIAKIIYELEDVCWDHINIYDCVYKMRASKSIVEQVLVRDGDTYYRCIRPAFTGLQYQAEGIPIWRPIGDRIWGNGSVVHIADNTIAFLTYVCENHSTELQPLLGDMWSIDAIDFTQACNEIFGNG